MRRMLFEKTGTAVWMSHLDTMRLMQRAFRRAGVVLHHSQGFTPHAYVSMLLPLSVGMESICEIMEYELDAALESVPVMVQDLFLAVPSSHPLAHRSSVQFEDFAEEKLIMMAKGSTIRRQLEKIYKESGHVPHLSFELQECHSVQQFVTLEMGLAIVPQAPEYRAEGLALVPIADERFKREIYCSWSKTRTLSPAVATLRDFIVEHYGSPQ